MSIFVNVVNQKMRIHSPIDEFASGSQKFVRFQFNLSRDWDGLLTFAQFQQNGVAYNQYLDEDNGVYLPPEIKVGTCTLMLYGSRDTVIATTNYLTLRINENNFISDAQSTEITESLYNQLVSKVDVFMSEAITHIDALADDVAYLSTHAATKQYVVDSIAASGSLPPVTSADNGKLLQVVNGVWAVVEIPFAEGVAV